MAAIDPRKTHSSWYSGRKGRIDLVELPPLQFLQIDGEGDPNTAPAYQEAVEALFGLSYTLKFAVKRGPLAIDYRVMPLEGLWWSDDMATFNTHDKSDWKWTLMIHQPEWITADLVKDASAALAARKDPPALPKVRFEAFHEGPAAQVLHVGPFTEEGPVIERLHAFIEQQGELTGKHHEIYLTDIRRAAPEKWRTIIRQPYRVG